MATQPLSLTAIWGEDMALDQIVEDVYGDGLQLMIGHLDVSEAQRRVENQDWYRPQLIVSHLEHALVRFDLHAPSCNHPHPIAAGRRCPSPRCSWASWVRFHWCEVCRDDPHAVPVTFAELHDVPTTTAPNAA